MEVRMSAPSLEGVRPVGAHDELEVEDPLPAGARRRAAGRRRPAAPMRWNSVANQSATALQRCSAPGAKGSPSPPAAGARSQRSAVAPPGVPPPEELGPGAPAVAPVERRRAAPRRRKRRAKSSPSRVSEARPSGGRTLRRRSTPARSRKAPGPSSRRAAESPTPSVAASPSCQELREPRRPGEPRRRPVVGRGALRGQPEPRRTRGAAPARRAPRPGPPSVSAATSRPWRQRRVEEGPQVCGWVVLRRPKGA